MESNLLTKFGGVVGFGSLPGFDFPKMQLDWLKIAWSRVVLRFEPVVMLVEIA